MFLVQTDNSRPTNRWAFELLEACRHLDMNRLFYLEAKNDLNTNEAIGLQADVLILKKSLC